MMQFGHNGNVHNPHAPVNPVVQITVERESQTCVKRTMMDREALKARLAERGLSIADFGRAIGRTRTVASRILNGEVKLQLAHVRPLSRLLGWSEHEVLKLAGLSLPQAELRTVPVVGEVQAGRLTDIEPSLDGEVIVIPHASDAAFALRVEGSSMDRIAPPGALVIVDQHQRVVAPGDLAVFRRAGEATFKRLSLIGNALYLTPESFDPTHAAIPLDGDEAVEVIGRVTGILGITSRADNP